MTVLDISRLLPGGFASLLFSRMGARVIKVEQPGVGDYYRALSGGAEFVALGHFEEIHMGKEFITLDLKSAEGKKKFKKLVRKVDVVIENFRPGVLKRLGLSYHTLKKWKRSIILCSITGSGQTGRYSRLGGHDLNYMALSGLLSMNIDSKGRPKIPDFQVIDLAVGYRSTSLILAALQERRRTGKGSWIDSSMLDVGLEMAALYKAERPRRSKRRKTPLESHPNYQVYQTKDKRYVAFAPLEPKFVRNFGKALKKDMKAVQKMRSSQLKKLFLSKRFKEWSRLGEKFDFCLSPVLQVHEACGYARGRRLPKMGRDNDRVFRKL
jgi:alpha-methylacyl-CoA racemase